MSRQTIRKAFINGQDVSQYVSAIPPIKSEQGLPGQVVINEIQSLTGANTTGFWDARTVGSPFYLAELGDFNVELYDDYDEATAEGNLLFSGDIKAITSDASGRTSKVDLRSNLQFALERGCIYLSEVPETPAQAIQNILELYKVPIESGSFSASSSVYTDADIFVVCKLINPEMTVLQALQSLADIGVGSISSTGGVVRFDAYRLRSGASAYTFTDALDGADGVTLWAQPKVSTVQKTKIDGYNIETAIAPATTGASDQQGKSIQAGNEAPITLVSQQAGVGVGELWLEYANRTQELVEWRTRIEIGRDLLLGYPVKLDYTRRDWQPLNVDVTLVDNSSQVFSTLRGLTR